MNKKYDIQSMQCIANERGGKCCSAIYENISSKLEWECKYGHIWHATPSNIIYGKWCPYCVGRRQTIVDMINLAKQKGGTCLSKKYITAKHKLKWKCSDGHTWYTSPDNVKQGSWCPFCRVNLSEEKCRFILESLFDVEFKRACRVFGSNYELDGLNLDLKLAFEYNGEQHYKIVWDRQKLMRSKLADAAKNAICADNGIKKIDIPYTSNTSDDDLVNFIINQVNDMLSKPYPEIQWSQFQPYRSKLKELQKTINPRHISCLTPYFPGSARSAEFRCETCEFVWKAKIYHVKAGSGCPQCAGKVQNIEMMQTLAKSKNGFCLSHEYVNSYTNLKWKCELGHVWEARPHNIKNGKWCPICGKHKAWETRRTRARLEPK